MLGNMDISPFRNLKSFSTMAEAEEYAKQILKDHVESQVLSSPKTPNQFDVAVVDSQKIDQFFHQIEQKSMDMKTCPVCDKIENINRFFKCVVCDFWECEACGIPRFFPKGLPAAHTCGEDEFEFLGNIGTCRSCHRPMGFRSIPQSLRVQMVGKTTLGRFALSTGLTGYYLADLLFVRKEIEVVLPETRALTSQLNAQQGNWDAWLKTFDIIMANYYRLSWAADYIKTMIDNPLFKMIGMDISTFFNTMATTVPYSHPELMFLGDLLKLISDMMARKLPGPAYLHRVTELQRRILPDQPGTQTVHNALTELVALGDNPGTPGNLPPLARILAMILPVPVSASSEPERISGKTCPNCLVSLPANSKFCSYCGIPL